MTDKRASRDFQRIAGVVYRCPMCSHQWVCPRETGPTVCPWCKYGPNVSGGYHTSDGLPARAPNELGVYVNHAAIMRDLDKIRVQLMTLGDVVDGAEDTAEDLHDGINHLERQLFELMTKAGAGIVPELRGVYPEPEE